MSIGIVHRKWGAANGREVRLFDIRDESTGLRVSVSNFGAILQAFMVEDGKGVTRDLVLGYDGLQGYINDSTFFGAFIGPIADRLAGGKFSLGETLVQLPLNAGPDSMHSGPHGFHRQVWDWQILDDGVKFYRKFSDMELGFPGLLEASLSYRLVAPLTLSLDYHAVCSELTAVSFTNHSYFNLNGIQGSCRDHQLAIMAERYAKTAREQDPIVTGQLEKVEGTPLDFRAGKKISDAIAHKEHPEICAADGVDHYFLVDGEGMRRAAVLSDGQCAPSLTCMTDSPGILVYTGNGIHQVTGKDGKVYGKNWGVCLETGRFPNAVNLDAYRPDVLLYPGEEYLSKTEFVIAFDE
ncbi:MAG: galactose mutarotase [Eubacteriales bacterium]|nr:galactose mutarotase [Eubacteriales bacterium]